MKELFLVPYNPARVNIDINVEFRDVFDVKKNGNGERLTRMAGKYGPYAAVGREDWSCASA